MNVKFKCMAIVIAAVGTVLSAQNVGGVKAQIVSERKGNTKVFEWLFSQRRQTAVPSNLLPGVR